MGLETCVGSLHILMGSINLIFGFKKKKKYSLGLCVRANFNYSLCVCVKTQIEAT